MWNRERHRTWTSRGGSSQRLKASIAHACFAVCSLCLLFECLLHLCQPTHLMGRKGWSQMEVPSGWLQVIRGPRPRSQRWPSAKMNADGPAGSSRALETVQGCHRESTGPKPRSSPDAAREIAQSSVTRFRESFGAMGDVQGPAVEVLKTELTKARAASKQPAVEVEIDQCRKFIARSERRIRELDTQRAGGVCSQDGGPGTSREVVGSAVPSPHHDAVSGSFATSDVTSADGEHLASRKRCVGARVAPGEAGIHRGRSARGQETSSREAGELMSRSSRSRPSDAKVRPQRRDVVVARPSSRLSTGSGARRLDVCDRVGQDDLGRGCSLDGDHDRPAIICGQHGDLVNAKLVSLEGCFVRNSVS